MELLENTYLMSLIKNNNLNTTNTTDNCKGLNNITQISPIFISAYLIQSSNSIDYYMPVNEWQFNINNPVLLQILNSIRYESNKGCSLYNMVYSLINMPNNIEEISTTDNKAFKINHITNKNQIDQFIKKHKNQIVNNQGSLYGSITQLISCSLNIYASWNWLCESAKYKLFHNNKVIRLDFCEDIKLQKNVFDNHVVSYLIPTSNGDFIGFRYTLCDDNSKFENLISIGANWYNYKTYSHNYKGFRLPAFHKSITMESIKPMKYSKIHTYSISAQQYDCILSVSECGHYISRKYPDIDRSCGWNDFRRDDDKYINFYTPDDTDFPSKFKFCVEVFYSKTNGSCVNTTTILATMIDENDLIY